VRRQYIFLRWGVVPAKVAVVVATRLLSESETMSSPGAQPTPVAEEWDPAQIVSPEVAADLRRYGLMGVPAPPTVHCLRGAPEPATLLLMPP
jgi:hypothetical protein